MSLRKLFVGLLAVGLLLGPVPAWSQEVALLDTLGVDLHGFVDARHGVRTQSDPYEPTVSLSEARLQLDAMRQGELATLQLRADFLYDDVPKEHSLDLEEGTGPIDLREANLLFSPLDIMDVKVGRQILTWGTGDLVFINDLFPKDWQSFFSGRDEEYLKAPSDALMVSLFPALANVDIVYTPRFDADRFISGERISYFNPGLGRLAGRDAVVQVDRPDDWLGDDEISLRISRNLSGYELALYGYDGFWKSPVGMDAASGRASFPKLRVYGASVRGALGKGLFNAEGGYYDSRQDRSGNDPLLPNSELRALLGYERELARDFSAGLQYYLERLQDYGAYRQSLAAGQKARDEDRHLLTLRLTRQALNQNLTLSLFTFYSPSDADAYLRPIIKYKASDALLLTLGANLFAGRDEQTFFGQFENNSNVYAGIRYSF